MCLRYILTYMCSLVVIDQENNIIMLHKSIYQNKTIVIHLHKPI